MLIPPNDYFPSEILGGAIALYDNAWPSVKETIAVFERIATSSTDSIEPARTFVPATIHASLDYEKENNLEVRNARTNTHLNLTYAAQFDEDLRLINNKYSDLISRTLGPYVENFGIHEQITDVEHYNVLRYQTGDHYIAHYDGGTGTKRSVSAILYLNDDYEGGEIEFVNFGIKIKPKAGTFLLFPSSYPHRHIAHPVISGTKYAIVTWLFDRD
jgi:Rps23 Pro-64 3,4-dihydroxylase Tpa1-like proline 4-hydroxylase